MNQKHAMDRMYGLQRHLYDATRKFYLLGRDQWPSARPFYGIMQLRARPDLADRVTIPYARPAS